MLTTPDITNIGAVVGAPASGTVLADTGQLIAGRWLFKCICGNNDSGPMQIDIKHRNAANNADIEFIRVGGNYSAGANKEIDAYFTLAANERVQIATHDAATGGTNWQATIFGFYLS
jgi:hypothetical protein